uniref:cilia- and flagella-associated protein 47-like n=1 Tax=Oncorhynchus gorbuscha TaxID=8017 RepID=UPI001EAEF570|nr:cilia- and flagella-associated protein 47-like [Oncorhynchus gorbuscha]
MWHPSFSSPLEGQFDLCVHQGNTAQLRCLAKLGSSSVQLSEKHLVFGSVPLIFPSVRTATLHNTGHNHAYFQVLDVYPLPGMVVTPTEGVVPVGGQAEVQVHLNPGAVMKFDTRVEILLSPTLSYDVGVDPRVNTGDPASKIMICPLSVLGLKFRCLQMTQRYICMQRAKQQAALKDTAVTVQVTKWLQ